MGTADGRADRPNLYFPIIAPNGKKVFPKRADGSDGRWRWSKDKVDSNPYLIEWVDGKMGGQHTIEYLQKKMQLVHLKHYGHFSLLEAIEMLKQK